MPGIDFREARARLGLAEVLDLLGFEPRWRWGEQRRGPCPVHRSRSSASRSFAAHLGKGVWHCFACGAGGNALDLWVAVTQQPLHAAVIDLCQRLGREVPWLSARSSTARRPKEQTMPEPGRGHADRAGELAAERRQAGTSANQGAERNRTLGTSIPRCTPAPPLPTSLAWIGPRYGSAGPD
jgi:hypothetical protein